jgi:hypothetical protein
VISVAQTHFCQFNNADVGGDGPKDDCYFQLLVVLVLHQSLGLGLLCIYIYVIMLLSIMLSEFTILERDYATYMLA